VISDEHLLGAAVILASGDNWLDLPIAEQGKRLGIPVCFVIEYTLMTRIRIAIVSEISLARLIKTIVWNLLKEGQRRSAFKKGAALQANGVPAEKAYRSHTGNLLMFLDTRLSASQMAIPKEVNRKIERLKSGAPIRLVFTGRLERIKGADHLIEVARRINVPFSLDIFGDGGLRESILDAVRRENLENCVHIHGPVDFATRLVPLLRTEADVFLCCHVQADPSCTYLETLGCGVPILGYSNEAWAGLLHLSGAGWSVPVGRPDLMAKKIGEMHHDRGVLGKKIEMGISFARVHSFESEFKRRVDHLTTLSDLTP
jgi:colanic acid/amylovoran biosynthesis glycosyltransferase